MPLFSHYIVVVTLETIIRPITTFPTVALILLIQSTTEIHSDATFFIIISRCRHEKAAGCVRFCHQGLDHHQLLTDGKTNKKKFRRENGLPADGNCQNTKLLASADAAAAVPPQWTGSESNSWWKSWFSPPSQRNNNESNTRKSISYFLGGIIQRVETFCGEKATVQIVF